MSDMKLRLALGYWGSQPPTNHILPPQFAIRGKKRLINALIQDDPAR